MHVPVFCRLFGQYVLRKKLQIKGGRPKYKSRGDDPNTIWESSDDNSVIGGDYQPRVTGSDEGESFDDDHETPAKYAKVSQPLPPAVSDENANHDFLVTMRTLSHKVIPSDCRQWYDQLLFPRICTNVNKSEKFNMFASQHVSI